MKRRGFLAALLLAVAGCATLPPPPQGSGAAWPDAWTLQGRFGVESGEERLSGQIRWKHRAGMDDLLLTSPLGQGVARILRDADGAWLELPEQPPRRAADTDTLTRDALGYALPVAGLAWWIQARHDPGRPFEAMRDAGGRLAQLKQDGWTIDYLQYAEDAPVRPRKLRLSREGMEIRLVADRWEAE